MALVVRAVLVARMVWPLVAITRLAAVVPVVDAAAQVLWAAPQGVVSLMISQTTFDWCERETLVRLMLDAVFSGLVTEA